MQNRRNTRSKLAPKLTPHKEEVGSSIGPQGRSNWSQSQRTVLRTTVDSLGPSLITNSSLLLFAL